ncbi:zinc finger Y-chromosomal protein-like [Macrosteles quadrilineatus]|uniref:zinc finger Y-chromosomal protein-like n=1 Tax=Macrosteles quadrilineatus TaxID=74068 RepID=UPI0023E0AE6D|nr:zinc finger Y-chromosomal protein-like [Macrosteles quadrilineatus]
MTPAKSKTQPRSLARVAEPSSRSSMSLGPKLECPSCKKLYKNKITLTRHMRYECGDRRPFACPLCEYRTKQKFQIKLHIVKKHKELLESAEPTLHYKVKLDNGYIGKREIDRLKRTSVPETPDSTHSSSSPIKENTSSQQWDVTFKDNDLENAEISLQPREDINTQSAFRTLQVPGGSVKYQCLRCDKIYLHRGSLSKHLNYECGDRRPFVCTFCPYRSKQKGNLKLHIYNKHQHQIVESENIS